MTRVLRPLREAETIRLLLFYIAELGLGIAGFVLLVVGWCLTLCFAITPLVVPLLVGLRYGVAGLAQAEGALARHLLRVDVRPASPRSTEGFWNRAVDTLRDQAFWRQQLHLLLAFPVALVPLCLLSWIVELLSQPILFQLVDSDDAFGVRIDTWGESLGAAAVGLLLLVGTAHFLRLWARLSRRLAARLLVGGGWIDLRTPEEKRAARLRGLTILSLFSTVAAATLVAIWWLTGGDDYFWPIWPILSLGLVLGALGWVVLVLEQPVVRRVTLGSQALAIQIGISAALWAYLVATWALTTGGYFWPVWPALCLGLLVSIHGAIAYGRRKHRIERLEESRAGAITQQESELRRIERDLHDGAQARLVALGISLGMAEQKLASDPHAVRELLAEARAGATEALQELRDLARGIHPPILTDRGLAAAVEALTARTPLQTDVDVRVPRRLPPAVETAAYFVVAEALANAIKHSGASRVEISIQRDDGRLRTEIVDDGAGGANPAGSGLIGLRRRVEALDGTLKVTSPEGGPTTISAELPCES